MAPGEEGAGEHGRQEHLPEALVARRPFEGCNGLPETVDRPPIGALGQVRLAQAQVRLCVQDALATGRGEGQGALGDGDGLVIHAQAVEIG